MTGPLQDLSRRHAAIIAGAMAILTLVGVGVAAAAGAPPDLANQPDAAAKALSSETVVRIAALGWFVAILGDVVRAWALYVFFRDVNRSVALLAAWFMLLHDAVFAAGLSGLVLAPEVGALAGPFATLPAAHAQAIGMVLLKLHFYGFHIGLLFFSFHLLLNGYLAFVSGEVPKVFGVLLFIAFVGYLVDSSSRLVLVEPPQIINQLFMVPDTVGELALMIWLWVKGGKSAPRAPA